MTYLTVVALALLIAASSSIGVLTGRHLNRIDHERIESRRWKTWQWEQELLSAAESRSCPGCALLRRRAELMHLPD